MHKVIGKFETCVTVASSPGEHAREKLTKVLLQNIVAVVRKQLWKAAQLALSDLEPQSIQLAASVGNSTNLGIFF